MTLDLPWLGKGFKSLQFLAFMASLSACADTSTLNLTYDNGGSSSNNPDLILVVSMSADGTRFKVNARFRDQETGEPLDFLSDLTTQNALKGCAAYMNYISQADQSAAAFAESTPEKSDCSGTMASALNNVFPGTLSALPSDPLSANGFTLVGNEDGYVFTISLHHLLTSDLDDDCFQIAAVKINGALYSDPITTGSSTTNFIFSVNNTLAEPGDTADVLRSKCFPILRST